MELLPDKITSIYYDLDGQGNQAMLFLKERGGYYFPHSPQAVATVNINSYNGSEEDGISGGELLKIIKIDDRHINIDVKGKLETYLINLELVYVIEVEEVSPKELL